MISIVIPLYNKANTIERTLKSILNQSYTDFEVIIVNDGSTDNSCDIVKKFNDSRIRLIHQANAGVSAARNKGIVEAQGEFIALMDADDEWLPDYLSTQIELTRKFPTCDIFAVNYKLQDYKGNDIFTIINKLPFKEDNGILSNYFVVAACSSPPICSISIMGRKEAFITIGGFPVGIKSGEDLLTWARLALHYKIAYSKIPLAIYHLDQGYEYGAEPVRRQDSGDPVGKELKHMLEKNPDIPGLKEYLSHWHKMRASVAIRFGERKETLKECFTALKYNIKNIKVIPFIVLSIIPSSLRKRIIALKKH